MDLSAAAQQFTCFTSSRLSKAGAWGGRDCPCPACQAQQVVNDAEKLLKRYLDNHCANADAEGMSTLCECKLCQDTRTELGMPVY